MYLLIRVLKKIQTLESTIQGLTEDISSWN